jgi:hypothetical protein
MFEVIREGESSFIHLNALAQPTTMTCHRKVLDYSHTSVTLPAD